MKTPKEYALALAMCFAVLLSSSLKADVDLKPRTLVPVKMLAAPVHEPLRLVDNGSLNFCVGVDFRHPPVSYTWSLIMMTNGVAEATGVVPAVVNLAKPETWREKWPYVIALEDGEIARANGLVTTNGK